MTTAKVAGLAALVSIFSASCKESSTDVYWHGHKTTIDFAHDRVVEHESNSHWFVGDFGKRQFTETTIGGMFDFRSPSKVTPFDSVTDPEMQKKIAGMRLLLANEKHNRKLDR